MNFSRYVGIPFLERGRTRAGADCWGLVVLFYAGELGIHLPAYDEPSTTRAERATCAAIISAAVSGAEPWRRVLEPAPGDVILCETLRQPIHVGVVVDRRQMLHVPAGGESVIERFTSPEWHRFVRGFFRYAR